MIANNCIHRESVIRNISHYVDRNMDKLYINFDDNLWAKMKSLTHLQFPDSGSLYKYFAIPTVFLKKSLLFEYFSANENVSAIRSSGFSRSGELTEIVEYRGPVIKSIMCISKMSIFLMSIYQTVD